MFYLKEAFSLQCWCILIYIYIYKIALIYCWLCIEVFITMLLYSCIYINIYTIALIYVFLVVFWSFHYNVDVFLHIYIYVAHEKNVPKISKCGEGWNSNLTQELKGQRGLARDYNLIYSIYKFIDSRYIYCCFCYISI